MFNVKELKVSLEALRAGDSKNCDAISLRSVRERTTFLSARDGHPESLSATESSGVMVEVRCGAGYGYAATADLGLDSLKRARDQAQKMATQVAKNPVVVFSPSVRPSLKGRYLSQVKSPLASRRWREWTDRLVQVSHQLRISPKIVRTQAMIRLVETEMALVNTAGAEVEQQFSLLSNDFTSMAKEGSVVQKRSDGGMLARSFQGGLERYDLPDLQDRVKRVAEQSLELVAAPECPTESMDLVLMPDQMMLQIHESIGHPLELDRILGDERNYAGSSFVKMRDFGHLQYGSSLLNVVYDPEVREEFASFGFDDLGAKAERQVLIEKGKLLRGLGGGESQERSGVKGVATSRACSWNRPPIDRMSNLNIEPGDSTHDEIIRSVERGVIMESNRSWSIDDYRNKFQFGCEYGRMIEKGKLTHVVRNPNYRGITLPFWHGLKMVGNAATREVFGTPYCGKGEPNQIIRVGHASPVCLFEGVEVFGGGA